MSEGPAGFLDLARGDYVRLAGLPIDVATDWRVVRNLEMSGTDVLPIPDAAAVAMGMPDHRVLLLDGIEREADLGVVLCVDPVAVRDVVRSVPGAPIDEMDDVEPRVEAVARTVAALEEIDG